MYSKLPEGLNRLTPYFILKDAVSAVDFYKYVFDAKEEFRLDAPDGTIIHAALIVGNSKFMMTEERAPMTQGISKSSTYLYIDDPDSAYKRAIEKGAHGIMEPENMFYGDRTACFIDPFGQTWTVALRIEEVSEDEIRKRAKKLFKKPV